MTRKGGFNGIAAACLVITATGLFTTPVGAQETRPGSEIRAERAALPEGVQLSTWVDGLEHPWGMAMLPTGGMLVTERPGHLRMISPDGTLSAPLEGVPNVDARGQGGLLDVALHPDFAKNAYVYLTFSEPGSVAGTNSTAVARARLLELNGRWSLSDTTIVFRQTPKYASSLHFGSRLVFARDGNLFVTLGERSSRSVDAQNPATHLGKVVRITDEGKVPEGNPMVGKTGALAEIWSMGHRNPQGAALNPKTGELWVAEHGPQGGDEINIVKAGNNYGWPKFTYGEQYGGGKIGEKASTPGYMPPIYSWAPSVSPSGITFYSSNSIPQWQGSLLVGALSGQALIRLQLDGNRVVKEERLLTNEGMRIRDVLVGTQGEVYLLTDAAKGRVLRLSPRPK